MHAHGLKIWRNMFVSGCSNATTTQNLSFWDILRSNRNWDWVTLLRVACVLLLHHMVQKTGKYCCWQGKAREFKYRTFTTAFQKSGTKTFDNKQERSLEMLKGYFTKIWDTLLASVTTSFTPFQAKFASRGYKHLDDPAVMFFLSYSFLNSV